MASHPVQQVGQRPGGGEEADPEGQIAEGCKHDGSSMRSGRGRAIAIGVPASKSLRIKVFENVGPCDLKGRAGRRLAKCNAEWAARGDGGPREGRQVWGDLGSGSGRAGAEPTQGGSGLPGGTPASGVG